MFFSNSERWAYRIKFWSSSNVKINFADMDTDMIFRLRKGKMFNFEKCSDWAPWRWEWATLRMSFYKRMIYFVNYLHWFLNEVWINIIHIIKVFILRKINFNWSFFIIINSIVFERTDFYLLMATSFYSGTFSCTAN